MPRSHSLTGPRWNDACRLIDIHIHQKARQLSGLFSARQKRAGSCARHGLAFAQVFLVRLLQRLLGRRFGSAGPRRIDQGGVETSFPALFRSNQ